MSFAALPAIELSWAQPTPSGGDTFAYYSIYRRNTGTTPYTRIAILGSISSTSYFDYNVASRQSYDYEVSWTVNRSSTLIESVLATVTTSLTFSSVFIHDVTAPSTYYLEYKSMDFQPKQFNDIVYLPIWGRQRPTAYIGERQWHTFQFNSIKFPLNSADFASTWSTLTTLKGRQRTNGSMLCLRTGTAASGGGGDRLFFTIDELDRHDQLGFSEIMIYSATESHYSEGV